jgi:transposase
MAKKAGPHRYPSDLTDEQWAVLEPIIEGHRTTKRGRPVKGGMRRVIDGILYVNKTGCQWRQVPHEYGHWMTLYSQMWRIRERGLWDHVLRVLGQQHRKQTGRGATPTIAIIDAQSTKTASKGGSAVTTRARRSKAVSGTSR